MSSRSLSSRIKSRLRAWWTESAALMLQLVCGCSCSVVALVILSTSIASAYAAAPKVSDSGPVSQNTLSENALLQFNAGGHILGFKPDKVYFASLDHAIVEEFVGTKGVMPVGEACLLYTSPSPRDGLLSRMPSSA